MKHAIAAAGFVLDVIQMLVVDAEVAIRCWAVETVHARGTFQTHLDDWSRMLSDGESFIREVAGDPYRLGDPKAMDRMSRELWWAFVD